MMTEVLEKIDRRLMRDRDSNELRNKGMKHNCIKTIMGNIEYDRRIYKFTMEDGANWIKNIAVDDDNAFYQLDPFHRNQAIVRNVSDKKARRQLISLFNCGNVEEGLQEITELLIKNNTNKKEFEKLTTLYNYLV